MNLLALDTSTHRAVLALATGDRIHAHVASQTDGGGRHGRHLLPAIAALLAAPGLVPRDLDAIAVGLGPGSYTGLRVGITAAKTLAFALGKPIVGIESFAAVARNATAVVRPIHVVGDAQRGDLYVQDFARPADGRPIEPTGPIRIVAMQEWATTLAPGAQVLGWALDRLRVAWPDHVHLGTPDQGYPSPAALIALATALVEAGQSVAPHALEPTYIRRSAAEDQWDRRA